jgi:hypothetical protein
MYEYRAKLDRVVDGDSSKKKKIMRLTNNLQQLVTKQANIFKGLGSGNPYATNVMENQYGYQYPVGANNTATPLGPSVHTQSREDRGMLDQRGAYMPYKFYDMNTSQEMDRFKSWAQRQRAETGTEAGGEVPIQHLLQQSLSRGESGQPSMGYTDLSNVPGN